MKMDVDESNNKILLEYDEVEEFDKFILVKHEQAFQVLNPEDYINIESSGFIPIEVSAYICEVSKWCRGIILKINDDYKSYNYLNDLIAREKLNKLYLEFIGEIQDDLGDIYGNISRED